MQSQKAPENIDHQQNVLVVKRSKPERLQVYEYQVSGKTAKYIDNANGLIYKLFSQGQYDFYEFVKGIKQDDQRTQIRPFIPQYLGVFDESKIPGMEELKTQARQAEQNTDAPKSRRNLWINHISNRHIEGKQEEEKYICLKNLTFNYENPNILDIKLGKKKHKKTNVKFQKSTTNSHGFRINGMVANLHNGEDFQQCFVSKYYGQKITVDYIENYLALFFFNGEKINKQLLESVLKELKEFISSFKKFNGVKFISSSLFVSYDANKPETYCLKLLDFDKYQHDQTVKEDTNISGGLENVAVFLQRILEGITQNQQVLLKKKLDIFGQDVLIVPESKMQKYKFKKAQQQQEDN